MFSFLVVQHYVIDDTDEFVITIKVNTQYKFMRIRHILTTYSTVFINLNFRNPDGESTSEDESSSESTVECMELTSSCLEESTYLQEVPVG